MDPAPSQLFDLYLDEVLNGNPVEPEAFCALHGADAGLAQDLQRIWQAACLESTPHTPTPIPEMQAEEQVPFERLGPYRLLRLLGEGGMGQVFLAQQDGLGRLCALKLIRQELAHSSSAGLRFEREARLVSEFRHPAIASVFGYGAEQGVAYFAMEWIPGENLAETIRTAQVEGRPLDPRSTIEWGLQIADALQYAHERGVLHRDVKPSNIRLSPDGRATLLDFGVAREEGSETLTRTGNFAGTPIYASPEQVAQRPNLDGRTDVYSLGATLYEALTGRAPFQGERLEQIVQAVLHEDPVPPSQLGTPIPRDLECVVMKALEKDPGRRYRSAAAFAQDLRAVLEVRPVSARPLGPMRRAWRWSRRHRWLAGAVASVLTLAFVTIGAQAYSRAQALKRDRREAAQLVERASDVIERYAEKRRLFEYAQGVLAGYRHRREEEWLDPAREAEITGATRDLDEYEQIRLSLSRAPEWLSQAHRLDPGAQGVDDAWAAYYYQMWLDVRDEPESRDAAHFREQAIQHDRTGTWTALLDGHARLQLSADPVGSEIHVFRYATVQDGPAQRSVPIPLNSSHPPAATWALTVSGDTPGGELRAGDLVLEVMGAPVNGTLFVARDTEALAKGDQLVAVDGRPLRELPPVQAWPPERKHRFEFHSATKGRFELAGRSLEDLGAELVTAGALLRAGGVRVQCWRRGTQTELTLEHGANATLTAAPLWLGPDSLVGPSPATFESQDPGWYLAYLEAPGREPLRVSFHIDHACEVYFKPEGVDLDPELLPLDTSPPGFAYLPIEALPGHDLTFWMQTHEVTAGQYLAFLNSPEVLPRVLGGESELIPVDPRLRSNGDPWPEVQGRVELPPGLPPSWPVLGVSWIGAEEYAHWRSTGEDARRRGLVYDLPTLVEWRWAAYGGDSRKLAFGNDFDPRWIKSRFAHSEASPEPVGSYPIDESPFGLFDLAGSAREWTGDAVEGSGGSQRITVGGSWLDSHLVDFQIRSARSAPITARDPSIGFRLVARRIAGEDQVATGERD